MYKKFNTCFWSCTYSSCCFNKMAKILNLLNKNMTKMFIIQNCQIKMVITIVLQQGQSVLFGVTSHTVKANLRKAFIINCFVKCSFFLILSHARNVCQPPVYGRNTNFLILQSVLLGKPGHNTG